MVKKYRVELKPLEPYFFAGEKSFGFGKKKKQSYNNYFIRSELFPTQTTLLGTIRYLILKKYNLLTTKDYSNEKEQEKYVGKSSFQIGQKNQSYGMIERLSPLFILNEKGELSMFDLCRELGLTFEDVALAIGWLARESKVFLRKREGMLFVSIENVEFTFG